MIWRFSYARRLAESAVVAAIVLAFTLCAATLYVAAVFDQNLFFVARVFLAEVRNVNAPLFAFFMLIAFISGGSK